MELEDKSPWEYWILSSGHKLTNGPLDKIAELAVSSYDLKTKNREEVNKDMRHCFILWWMANRSKFHKYKTITSISQILESHHATILHYMNYRKKSPRFDANVKCLIDFLTS